MAKAKVHDLAVVTADTHLRTQGRKGKPIEGDSQWGFDQIIDYAVKRGVPWVICAGDILDTRKNEPEPAVFLEHELGKLSQAGVKFGYVQGQHEIDETPWCQLGETAVHLDQHGVKIGRFNVWGLDYQPTGKLQEKLEKIPEDADILVAHQVWANWMGDVTNPQGEFADIPHARRLITGDLHETKEEIHRNKDGQKMKVISPGSTWLTAFDHPQEKFFFVLQSDGKFRKEPLSCRPFREFRLAINDDFDDLVTNLDEEIETCYQEAHGNGMPPRVGKAWWRIVYTHKVDDVVRRLTKLVDNRVYLFWKSIPRPKEESALAEKARRMKEASADDNKAITLQSALPELIDKEEDPEVFALCETCLAAGDSRDDINAAAMRWMQEQIGDDDAGEGEGGSAESG